MMDPAIVNISRSGIVDILQNLQAQNADWEGLGLGRSTLGKT